MSKQYVAHWAPVRLEPVEVLARVEPILAEREFAFTGSARRLERGPDALYYQMETLSGADAASDLLRDALARGWRGVALELFHEGYHVPLSFYSEGGRCTMILDEDSPLFYEQDATGEAARSWTGFLLELTASIESPLCLFEKEPAKRVLDAAAAAEALASGGLAYNDNPVVAIVHESLLPSWRADSLRADGIKVRVSTSGYTIFTWMGPYAEA